MSSKSEILGRLRANVRETYDMPDLSFKKLTFADPVAEYIKQTTTTAAAKLIEVKPGDDLNDLIKTEQNFKSRLIEWTQKYRVTIEYELVDTYNDADNNPIFRTAVMLGGIYAGDATGYSKKESHQGASKIVLERIKTDRIFREQVLSTTTASN